MPPIPAFALLFLLQLLGGYELKIDYYNYTNTTTELWTDLTDAHRYNNTYHEKPHGRGACLTLTDMTKFINEMVTESVANTLKLHRLTNDKLLEHGTRLVHHALAPVHTTAPLPALLLLVLDDGASSTCSQQ